jgi:iron(III) transport system ATP-binding protein
MVIQPGEFFCLLGPSGCGKTTTLNLIGGFIPLTSGDLLIEGRTVKDLPPHKRNVNTVFQSYALFPHMTVAENVAFGLRMEKLSKADITSRTAEYLELVGLRGLAGRLPAQMSGGQQQRVALARALAVHPRLVLLDEPFASLDAALRSSVRTEVIEILRKAGATALLVTHDQDEALSLSDAVAVLRGGVIAQLDTPHELYARPADPDLAGFVGDVNLIEGTVDGAHVVTALGRLPLDQSGTVAPAGPVLVMVRPEQLVLRLVDGPSADAACTVLTQEFYGHDAIVRVSLNGAETPNLVVRVRGDSRWSAGGQVTASVDGPVVAYSTSTPTHGP